jgi:uncharacterized membrane protein YeiB
MGKLEVRIRHGGGGDGVAVLGALAGCAIVCVAAVKTARAVAAIPAPVIIAIPVVIIAATLLGLRALLRSTRRQAQEATAQHEAHRAEWEAAEQAAALARHQRRLELAAASAPVIHNWIVPEQVAAARERGFTPTTVFTHQKEIPQR